MNFKYLNGEIWLLRVIYILTDEIDVSKFDQFLSHLICNTCHISWNDFVFCFSTLFPFEMQLSRNKGKRLQVDIGNIFNNITAEMSWSEIRTLIKRCFFAHYSHNDFMEENLSLFLWLYKSEKNTHQP